jgi:hypothetical protein
MSHVLRHIFSLAEQLEPDRVAIWEWLWHTPIETLGGHTAIELAFAGDGLRVVAMLEAALQDHTAWPLHHLPYADGANGHLEPCSPGSI